MHERRRGPIPNRHVQINDSSNNGNNNDNNSWNPSAPPTLLSPQVGYFINRISKMEDEFMIHRLIYSPIPLFDIPIDSPGP